MDFTISKEQKQFVEAIVEFAKTNLNHKESMEKFSLDMWKKISDFGFLGLTIGEKYGGLEESYLTASLAIEALGYGCKNNGFVFAVMNHIWVCQNLIYLYGTELLKDKYLERMVNGELPGAIAITEAESGSDALAMKTTAVEKDGFYILNGTKMFISNGPIANLFIVFALTEEGINRKITAFVVDRNFEGVSTGKEIEKMGLGACPTSELILNHVCVPKENVLGQLNSGAMLMTAALEWERFYEFVPHIGVMQRIMELSIEQAKARKQFSKPIEEYQAISHKIAEMKIAIEMSRQMMYKIAWLKDNGKSAYEETAIFKTYVSENYIKTCRDAMQIFGAYGYSKEYEIERELRDALASSIYSGTNEMQKNTIYNMATCSFF